MRSWDLLSLPAVPDAPEVDGDLPQTARVLSSSADARAIALHLPAGHSLPDHEVHERAWLVVVEGEVEIEAADGATARGGSGLLIELDPRERHEVRAREEARLLLLLTPWPGPGHPGTMSLDHKRRAREGARRRAEGRAA